MGEYVTGTGQRILNVHAPEACAGGPCVIHAPSAHHMRDWPTHWRSDRGLMERICEHGTGHPDPDSLAFIRRSQGRSAARAEGIHGCCGCCVDPDHTPPPTVADRSLPACLFDARAA